jgi:hypothetical protein
MFTRFITASAVSVTLAFSSAAFAASTDFIDNIDHTTDTISGLHWLDVTKTTGRSYADVSGKFGTGEEFAGYRYATGTEFNQMVSNFTGVAIAANTYSNVSHTADSLVELMGFLGYTYFADGTGTQTEGLISDIHQNIPSYMYYYSANIVDDATRTITAAHYDYNGDTSTSNYGSFLVRDSLIATPIPAAAFMFAPALLGFLGFRRSKMQA